MYRAGNPGLEFVRRLQSEDTICRNSIEFRELGGTEGSRGWPLWEVSPPQGPSSGFKARDMEGGCPSEAGAPRGTASPGTRQKRASRIS